jgi:uncharacterized protein (DUF111 family)
MTFEHNVEHVDEHMLLIQVNIDDMNPEMTTYISEMLFHAGANDVYWVPIIMKKGRPGMMLNVLAEHALLSKMEHIIFTETTTLGIRYIHATCHRLAREFVSVQTSWGPVQVKVGYYQGKRTQFAPEFKDCESLAKKNQIPLKLVYEQARQRYLALTEEDSIK